MVNKNEERVAAFSAALNDIYKHIEEKRKINFSEIGRRHNLKSYSAFIKKALQEKHLINADATKWNPNLTTPNDQLALQIYLQCKEYRRIAQSESISRKPKVEKVSYEEIPEKHLSLDETVELVKYYGLLKVIWKCLF